MRVTNTAAQGMHTDCAASLWQTRGCILCLETRWQARRLPQRLTCCAHSWSCDKRYSCDQLDCEPGRYVNIQSFAAAGNNSS
jgi:hypothetical protein